MSKVNATESELAEFVVTLAIFQSHATAGTVEMLVQAGLVSEPMARHLLHQLAELSSKMKTSNPLIAEMWADTLSVAAARLERSIN